VSATSTPRRGELLVAPARETADTASARQSASGTGAIYVYTKRCMDVVGALLLLLVSAPVFLLIAVLIVLDSRGPAFYRQERVGARGRRRGRRIEWEERRFRILKFRTMACDADRSPVHERFVESFVAGGQLCDSGAFKLCDDPRVTRIGRFLRATSLDELPQLINVLRGTMSLVGPRPVPPYEVAHYQPWHRERLAATPGMTGPWQIQGRGRVSFEEMVRLDIQYVREASLRHDLVLLLRTLPAVWSKDGAR
jgi:lipopolysaccharide/colanic/teichoic acid biosynthesis glycosyltransferase